jgi:hypothetical protein
MPSSGMWRLVDLIKTDVSEELIGPIFKVEEITGMKKNVRRLLTELLQLEVPVCKQPSNTSSLALFLLSGRWRRHDSPKRRVLQDTRRHIPEDGILYT